MSAPADFGLEPAPTLTALEAVLITRWMEQHASNGGPVRQVEPYQDQIEKWLKAKALHGPAALVHVNGGDDEAASIAGWQETLDVQMYLAVHNYRGDQAARRGGVLSTGALALVELAYALFAGWKPVAAADPMVPVGWRSVIAPEDRLRVPFAIYRYDFALSFHRPRPLATAVTDAAMHLKTVTTFDLEGGPEAPDEGTADVDLEVTHPA